MPWGWFRFSGLSPSSQLVCAARGLLQERIKASRSTFFMASLSGILLLGPSSDYTLRRKPACGLRNEPAKKGGRPGGPPRCSLRCNSPVNAHQVHLIVRVLPRSVLCSHNPQPVRVREIDQPAILIREEAGQPAELLRTIGSFRTTEGDDSHGSAVAAAFRLLALHQQKIRSEDLAG